MRVGIEATGHTRWFERLLAELGHELWIGDAAQIRASMVRKQKTDARDAAHLLQLLMERTLPAHLAAARRSAICGSWCGIARSWCGCATRSGINCTRWPWVKAYAARSSCSPKKDEVELQGLGLGPWASYRRQELLQMLDQLDLSLEKLDRRWQQAAERARRYC